MKKLLLLPLFLLASLVAFSQTKCNYMDFSISWPWFNRERVENYTFQAGAIFTIQQNGNNYKLTLSDVPNPDVSFTVEVRYKTFNESMGQYAYVGKATLSADFLWPDDLEGLVVVFSNEKLSSFLKGRNLPAKERENMLRSKTLFFFFERLMPVSVGGRLTDPLNTTIGICPHESITEKELKQRQEEAARKAEQARLARIEAARKEEEALAIKRAHEEQLKYIYREAIRQSDSIFNRMNDSLENYIVQNHVKACFSEMNRLKSNYDITYYHATDTGSIINIAHVILLASPDQAIPTSSNGSFRMNKDKRENKQIIYKKDWIPTGENFFYISSPNGDKFYNHEGKMYLVRTIPTFKIQSYSATLGLMVKKKETKYYPSRHSVLPDPVKYWCEQNITKRGSFIVKYVSVNDHPYCTYSNEPIPGFMRNPNYGVNMLCGILLGSIAGIAGLSAIF